MRRGCPVCRPRVVMAITPPCANACWTCSFIRHLPLCCSSLLLPALHRVHRSDYPKKRWLIETTAAGPGRRAPVLGFFSSVVDTTARSLVFALAARRRGGWGGVACEECVPRFLALGRGQERAVHLLDRPAPLVGERRHVRGVEPGGNGRLGETRLAPAHDARHDGLL